MAGTITKGLIGKQDESLWDGTSTMTYTRVTSSGYRLTLNKMVNPGVDVCSVYGGGTLRNVDIINLALTAIGTPSTVVPLYLSRGTWTFDESISIPAGYAIVTDVGTILDADNSICDVGTAWTWTNHAGSVYKLDQTIHEPANIFQSGIALTEVANAAAIVAAGQWAWEGSKLYVWTTGSTDPDTLASGLLQASYQVEFLGPFIAEKTKVFSSYSTIVFGAGSVDCVFPEWWGAVPDGATDCYPAIQAAINSIPSSVYGGTVKLGSGVYAIGTGLTRTTSAARFALIGEGKGITNILATAAIDMLTFSGVAGTLSGYATIRGIYFDGDSVANIGIKVTFADYMRLDDVRIQYTTDEGIYFDDAEDILLLNCHVFRCGDSATSKPGVGSYCSGEYNNSIQVLGCTFERNLWHSFYALNTTKLSFHGNKFHGVGITGGDSPTEVDLLHMVGCEGAMVIGNQFVNSRRYGIYCEPTTGGANFDLSVSIIGNRFDANSIATPTVCGNVRLETGFAIIDGNQFGGAPNETAPYAGYALIGHDISIGASAWGAVGTNVATTGAMTRTTEDFLLCSHDISYPRPLLLARGGKRYHADKWSFAAAMTESALEFWTNDTNMTSPRWKIDREGQMTWQGGTAAHPLFSIDLDGTISWGGGTNAVDTVLERSSANALTLAAGDKFRADRVKFIPLAAQPDSPTEGDVAYDDGTGWSGGAKGLYCYTGAAWVKMT